MPLDNVVEARRFGRALRVWANGVPAASKAFHGRRLITATNLIIQNTPRDTGRTRGEWQVSLYFPKVGLIGRIRPQTAVINEAREVAAKMRPFARTWIVNNSKHIMVLEHGLFIPKNPGPSKDRRKHRFGRIWVINGFSVQAPRGILKPVFEHMNRAGVVVKSNESEV